MNSTDTEEELSRVLHLNFDEIAKLYNLQEPQAFITG